MRSSCRRFFCYVQSRFIASELLGEFRIPSPDFANNIDNEKRIEHPLSSFSPYQNESGPPTLYGKKTILLPIPIPPKLAPPLLVSLNLPVPKLPRTPLSFLSPQLQAHYPPLLLDQLLTSPQHLFSTYLSLLRPGIPGPRRKDESITRKTSVQSVWTCSSEGRWLGFCRVGMSSTRTNATSG